MLKQRVFIAAALMAASAVLAQTSTVTPREDRGYQPMRGTSNVGKPVATEKACEDAIAVDVLARKATSLYKCRHETVKLGTYSAAPPPVVCPAPPAPTAAVIACAAPLVGQWTQTTTVSIGPAPTCTRTVTLAPSAAPAGACTTPPVEPTGPTLYFSDCQAGAAASCSAGNNANPGTQAQPKRTLDDVNVNALAAGTRLLFARGGAWAGFRANLYNLNATPTSPITFDAYGSGPAPILASTEPLFGFSTGFGESGANGGYVLRNLVIDGMGVAGAAIRGAKSARFITLDTVEIRRSAIAILMFDDTVRNLTVRNSNIHDNVQHGLLGSGTNWTIEGNTFERNGDARPPSTHAIYFSSGPRVNTGLVIRGNVFRNNSQQGGACRSGNITAHGQITDVLIEGNRIEADTYGAGCRAISLTAGYGTVEFMRNTVVRNNASRNAGAGVAYSAAPGIVIEGNSFTDDTMNTFPLIERASNTSGPSQGTALDDADRDAVVRNNTVCARATAADRLISIGGAGTLSANTTRTGNCPAN
jgi:hypothetical protein